ncbi:MAG: molybdopterin-dependent oxidoreductase [Coriobacteriales bacterium]|jgi:anaerobic selenocysteine-containing dehydrogenase|nr:molybdopterin-dependent oxidoreductase [Coriobacteriales bacterium]
MAINEYNKDLYKEDWRWYEDGYEVTRTSVWTGPGCHNGCGVLCYTKDGKLEKIEGDPNFGYNQGRLCLRCINMVENIYNNDRLKWPLMRDGEKGENKWRRVTWEEAFDWIEETYAKICATIKNEYGGIGPEGIVVLSGTGRNAMWHGAMVLRAVFGSPNIAFGFLSADSCYQPRMTANLLKEGDCWILDASQLHPDRYDNKDWKCPEAVLVWGNEPLASNPDGFVGHWIIDLMRRGTKLVVIDPALTWLASKADIWLRVRPGTDCALALGFLNVIINEGLYDEDFVDNWTYGFDELKQRVQEYTPEKVAETCWVPAEQIVEAARLYANAKPAGVQWGLAIDMQISAMEASAAISDLVAITGNLDVPGGNVLVRYAYNSSKKYGCGIEFISPEMLDRRIGTDQSPIHKAGYTPFIPPDLLLEAMENGVPYRPQMLWVHGTNPIANMAGDAPRVYKAWQNVPYTVVCDYYITPTAVAFADLVLPMAMSVERDSFRSWWQPLRSITQCAKRYHECKMDEELVLELGQRFNPGFFGQFEDLHAFLTWMINDDGHGVDYDYDELNHRVYDWWEFNETYEKYKKGLLREDGQPGFVTATGLYEIYSPLFDVWGFDPLPHHMEPFEGPYSTPELYQEYPYIYTSGHRHIGLFHSEHRQLPSMREVHPTAIADLSPEIAEEIGVVEGDWVWFENKRGKCKQQVHIAPGLLPNLVRARHGWWFPEKQGAEPVLFGVFDSNGNNLTTMGVHGPTHYGAPYKSTLCKCYKVTPENDCSPSEIVTQKGGFGYVSY